MDNKRVDYVIWGSHLSSDDNVPFSETLVFRAQGIWTIKLTK